MTWQPRQAPLSATNFPIPSLHIAKMDASSSQTTTAIPSYHIPFAATNPITEYSWTCALHVLHHLLYHPQERQKINQQAQQKRLEGYRTFAITHFLLPKPFQIGAGILDSHFIDALHMAIFHQEEQCKALNHLNCRVWRTPPAYSTPYHYITTFPLKDPLDPYETMDEKLTEEDKYPCLTQ